MQDTADEMGWTTGILSITTGIKDNKEKEEDFMFNYGTLTLEQVIASELQYIDGESRLRSGHIHALQVLDGIAHQQSQEEGS